MKIAKLRTPEGVVLGIGLPDGFVVRADYLNPQAPSAVLEFLALPEEERRRYQEGADRIAADRELWTSLKARGMVAHIDEVPLEAPVDPVPKFICLALNYRAHAEEGGFVPPKRPVIFFKGQNSLSGHGAPVVVPPLSRRVDFEGELGVLIGKRCKGLTEANWQEAVAGYTIINDMTARDLQLEDIELGHPWDFTKSFDTYGPTGPWLVTPDEVADPQALNLEVRVDGQTRQKGNTRQMIFSVKELLLYISSVITLEPGDLIATGTCDGIGPAEDGAVMEVQIGNLGVLRNRVEFTR